MPMFVVVLVYALPGIYERVEFTPRNGTVVCCVACLIPRLLDLVYAVWRLASWRYERIDARTRSDDWHMGWYTMNTRICFLLV